MLGSIGNRVALTGKHDTLVRRAPGWQEAPDGQQAKKLVKGDASAIAQFREEVSRIIAKYATDLDRSCHDEFVQFLKYTIELKINRQPILMLKHLLNEPFMSSCFPNVTIALRLYLTLPVTVCEGERSFSNQKPASFMLATGQA